MPENFKPASSNEIAQRQCSCSNAADECMTNWCVTRLTGFAHGEPLGELFISCFCDEVGTLFRCFLETVGVETFKC